MKVILLLIFFMGTFFSCTKNEPAIELKDEDFLVFGHFYGECIGENCVVTYKITKNAIFKDILKRYNGSSQDFVELDIANFEIAKDLIEFLPDQLFNETGSIIGCPDCTDGGGLFIQYARNGKVQSWRIDQTKNNVPEYLHEFIDKVNEKIKLLNP